MLLNYYKYNHYNYVVLEYEPTRVTTKIYPELHEELTNVNVVI